MSIGLPKAHLPSWAGFQKKHKRSSAAADAEDEYTVYLIRQRLGGFANDLLVRTEDGGMVYHIKSSMFSMLGHRYLIYDALMREVMRTEQLHTAVFPRHKLFKSDLELGTFGQTGVIPRKYAIQLEGLGRAEVCIGSREPIYTLRHRQGVLAEIAQYRRTWIVIIHSDKYHYELLACIGVLYREDAITG